MDKNTNISLDVIHKISELYTQDVAEDDDIKLLLADIVAKSDISSTINAWKANSVGKFSRIKNRIISLIRNIVINILEKSLQQQTNINQQNTEVLELMQQKIKALENELKNVKDS